MEKFKKINRGHWLLIIIISFTVTSIVFASSRNSISLKVFKSREVVTPVKIEIQKASEEKINDLQIQLDELKRQKSPSAPTSNSVTSENNKSTEKIVAPVPNNKKCMNGQIVSLNENCTKICPDGEVLLENLNCRVAKNYYLDYKIRVSSVISLEKSYITWLQDTSNQFRSASITLAGYPTTGLYGQIRDKSIEIANAETSVISSIIAKESAKTSALETAYESFKSDPNMFISENTYNQLPTIDYIQADIEGSKKIINDSLNLVLGSLQYH